VLLWTRLLGRRDPIPIEFPRELLAKKGIGAQPPTLFVGGPPDTVGHWDEGFAAVNAALLLNLQRPDVLSTVRYAHPAPAFHGVYLWDSAFIAQAWRVWDVAVAADVIRSVVRLREGDRLQHVVADFVQSAFTQPPLIAWATARLVGSCPSALADCVLSELYDPLVAFNSWLYRNRQLENGLFAWRHPYESGIDNSPRFSSADESQMIDTRRLAAVDFSAYMVLQNESLAILAERTGRNQEAADFRRKAQDLGERINRLLWSDEAGFYFDRNVDTGQFVTSQTIAGLLPLWSGVPGRDRAERIRDLVMDTEAFNTEIPLPSVARNDPVFAKDMWRGPVWINLAYAVIQGLQRYGFFDEAADLAYRLCDGVFRTFADCRRIYEFYDPDRPGIAELCRKRGNRWKHFTLGNKPVADFAGWSSLVNALVVESLVGYHRDGRRGTLRPLIPRSAAGLTFSLRMPAEGLSVSVERDADDRIHAVVHRERCGPGTQPLRRQADFGAAIDFEAADPLATGPDVPDVATSNRAGPPAD
jgi:hypothetical protein